MRVAVFGPWLSERVSGGDRYLYALADAIAVWGHDVEVISMFPAGARARALHPAGPGRLYRWLDASPRRHLYRDLLVSRDAMRATRGRDLGIVQHFMGLSPARARRNVLVCQFPHLRVPWRSYWDKPLYWPYALLRFGLLRPELGSYAEVVCYSEYVRGWIRRRWQVDSVVLPPPVEPPPAGAAEKAPIVVSVARFFARGYNKGHPEMLAAFRGAVEAGLQGWELHLVGSRHYDEPEDRDYYDGLVRAAAGLPVVFHPDAPQAEVDALLARAAIFWHAAGTGQDLEAAPEFAEHFGISTVEAMGAGAVPVVMDAGGQAEIVRENVDGFRFRTVEELAARTLELARNPGLLRRMSAAARERAGAYSPDAFRDAVAGLLRRVTA